MISKDGEELHQSRMLPNTMEKVVKIEATPIRQYRVNHCRFPPINKSKVEDWKEYDPE